MIAFQIFVALAVLFVAVDCQLGESKTFCPDPADAVV